MGKQSAEALENTAVARRITISDRHDNYTLTLSSDSGASVQVPWESLSSDARDAFDVFRAEVLGVGGKAMAESRDSP